MSASITAPTCPRCDEPLGSVPEGQRRTFIRNGQYRVLMAVCSPCAAVFDLPVSGEPRKRRSDS